MWVHWVFSLDLDATYKMKLFLSFLIWMPFRSLGFRNFLEYLR